MTRTRQNCAGLSASDTKFLQDIQTHGWHVTRVFASKGEAGPEWAFSTGLFQSFSHPEVVVFGLTLDVCMSIVNGIGLQVKAGKRFESVGEYGDILNEPYKCAFRLVQPTHYREYLGRALWFYEDDPFPTTQCFWPDKDGKFPWDESCNSVVRDGQPLLFVP